MGSPIEQGGALAAEETRQKKELYHALYQLNAAFADIIERLQTLQQTGLVKLKVSRRHQAFTQELQGEINSDLLEALHREELADWARFGKARQRWEEYLRGSTSRTPKKAIR
jgi:hypothetical protein